MKKVVVSILFLVFFIPGEVYARSGCCSHHGGVAGCSASGRQICVDGSLSPTCTCDGGSSSNNSGRVYTPPSYVYGCTDSNALNYNSSATKDDGSCIAKKYGCMDNSAINYDSSANVEDNSCQYKKEKTMTEIIEYEIKYQENADVLEGKQKTISKGKDGEKEVLYEVIVDKDGNEISKKKVSEKVILEPKDEVIEKGIKEESIVGSLIMIFIWILSLIFNFSYFHSHKDNNLILTRIPKQKESMQLILYLGYVISIILPIIDSIIILTNLLKAKKV